MNPSIVIHRIICRGMYFDNLKRRWVVNEAMGKYRGINHNWAREKSGWKVIFDDLRFCTGKRVKVLLA